MILLQMQEIKRKKLYIEQGCLNQGVYFITVIWTDFLESAQIDFSRLLGLNSRASDLESIQIQKDLKKLKIQKRENYVYQGLSKKMYFLSIDSSNHYKGHQIYDTVLELKTWAFAMLIVMPEGEENWGCK